MDVINIEDYNTFITIPCKQVTKIRNYSVDRFYPNISKAGSKWIKIAPHPSKLPFPVAYFQFCFC